MKDWVKKLESYKPWRNNEFFDEDLLLRHETHQFSIARLYGMVQWGENSYGLHPAGRLKINIAGGSNKKEITIEDLVAITSSGTVLVCSQKTFSIDSVNTKAYLMAISQEFESPSDVPWRHTDFRICEIQENVF